MSTTQIVIICAFASFTLISITLIVAGCWMRERERRASTGTSQAPETYREQLKRRANGEL